MISRLGAQRGFSEKCVPIDSSFSHIQEFQVVAPDGIPYGCETCLTSPKISEFLSRYTFLTGPVSLTES